MIRKAGEIRIGYITLAVLGPHMWARGYTTSAISKVPRGEDVKSSYITHAILRVPKAWITPPPQGIANEQKDT